MVHSLFTHYKLNYWNGSALISCNRQRRLAQLLNWPHILVPPQLILIRFTFSNNECLLIVLTLGGYRGNNWKCGYTLENTPYSNYLFITLCCSLSTCPLHMPSPSESCSIYESKNVFWANDFIHFLVVYNSAYLPTFIGPQIPLSIYFFPFKSLQWPQILRCQYPGIYSICTMLLPTSPMLWIFRFWYVLIIKLILVAAHVRNIFYFQPFSYCVYNWRLSSQNVLSDAFK